MILPVAFFQTIVGVGTPCAWQCNATWRFLSTLTSVGSTIHLGGTGTSQKAALQTDPSARGAFQELNTCLALLVVSDSEIRATISAIERESRGGERERRRERDGKQNAIAIPIEREIGPGTREQNARSERDGERNAAR